MPVSIPANSRILRLTLKLLVSMNVTDYLLLFYALLCILLKTNILKRLVFFNISTALAYVKKMPDDVSVVEGEKLKIHCLAMGTEPEITWMIGNYFENKMSHHNVRIPAQLFPINIAAIGNSSELDSSRVKLLDHDKQKDAILLIEHAELSDRNYYNCTAKNKATGFTKEYEAIPEQTYIRVKGNRLFIEYTAKKHGSCA